MLITFPLTVKEKTGRKRYIALRLTPPPHGRSEFARALQNAADSKAIESSSVKLLILRGDIAVISCNHRQLPGLRSLLNGEIGESSSKTLRVSGTVKTIKESFGLD